jgi:glycosyltransferase involved in cell wall biosynthesis
MMAMKEEPHEQQSLRLPPIPRRESNRTIMPPPPIKRVLLLSGNLKLSGVATWFLEMQAALLALENIETVFIVTSNKNDLHPHAGRVFYTGKARSALHLKVARWFQLHKIFPRRYAQEEKKVLNTRVKKILMELGWQARIDAIIKNLPDAVPLCLRCFPVIGVAHSIFSPDLPEFEKAALQAAASLTRHVIAVGQVAADGLRGLGLPVAGIIHNPLDIQRIRDASFAYAPEMAQPYIVFAGGFHNGKGVHSLLQAFALLKERVDLVYVGRGPELEALRQEAIDLGLASRVHFVGFQKNPYPWIRCAKLLVLPSASEAMPYAALEGVALGCGVIVTDFPAAAEFFVDEIIVPHLPAESFTRRLAERISQGLLGNLPFGAKPGVLEGMAPERVARKYLEQAGACCAGDDDEGTNP